MVPGPGQRMAEQLRPWLSDEGEKRFFQFNDLVFFFPGRPDALIDVLLQSLKIVYAGCNMATTKGEKLIPEHPLALSNELDKSAFGVIDLTKDDALRYLRKETLPPSPAAERGFALVSYRNVPLGWVNVLQNRMNNLYPSSWRIRM